MTPQEYKLWAEELNRVHKQLIDAMKAYERTIDSARKGKLSKPVAQKAIATTLESVELCRQQVERTRRTVLKMLG